MAFRDSLDAAVNRRVRSSRRDPVLHPGPELEIQLFNFLKRDIIKAMNKAAAGV